MRRDPLASLLDLRSHQEKTAAQQVASNTRTCRTLEDAVRAEQECARKLAAPAKTTVEDFSLVEAAAARHHATVRALEKRVVEAHHSLESACRAHTAARQQKRTMEKLVEHREEARAQDERRAERRDTDELVLLMRSAATAMSTALQFNPR